MSPERLLGISFFFIAKSGLSCPGFENKGGAAAELPQSLQFLLSTAAAAITTQTKHMQSIHTHTQHTVQFKSKPPTRFLVISTLSFFFFCFFPKRSRRVCQIVKRINVKPPAMLSLQQFPVLQLHQTNYNDQTTIMDGVPGWSPILDQSSVLVCPFFLARSSSSLASPLLSWLNILNILNTTSACCSLQIFARILFYFNGTSKQATLREMSYQYLIFRIF